MDRSIILELRRKLPSENVQRLRHADADLFPSLASRLARFAKDNSHRIRSARPSLPEALNDRAQDNWEPLLAIADVAGGQWPDVARKTSLKISGSERESLSRGTQLLADINALFDARHWLKVAMIDLVSALCEDEENDWSTYNRGQRITPRQLGRLLGEYGIKSKTVSIGSQKPKGFERLQFEEVWLRYLALPATPLLSVTQSLPNDINGLMVTEGQSRDQAESALGNRNLLKSLRSDRVTDESLPSGNEAWEVSL